MKAIDQLMDEHRVIECVLEALEVSAARLARGETVRPGFFLECADFAAGFADGCHHRKEEGVLFPVMMQHGEPAKGGILEAMLDEHEEGRAYVRQLRNAARQLEAGEPDAARGIVAAARGYAALLREHIAKEDEVLFPMAAEMIPEPEHDTILARFGRVEHDDAGAQDHARLLDLAGRLQREAGSLSAPTAGTSP
ncbi:MAG TPA: hemerythrin domain-containing protein [Gemmatimonadaceae bacterium]|nr:hemerythrin domain-containing protein [Gemmatimonadaceae bacterium]